ncbi:MAG: alpha/beta fold hydrolase [Bacteroidota bacterium]
MKLNFIKLGAGEPLIILHGLFGMLDNWMTLGKRFSENYEVYLIDQRNHGKSPHCESHTYSDLCEDLDLFIKNNNIVNPSLIGHSMGGKVVMNYALNYNQQLAKIIVADIAPRNYSVHYLDIVDTIFKIDIKCITSRAEAENTITNLGVSVPITQFLLKNLERISSNSFKWKFNLEAISANRENLGVEILSTNKFENPALFLKGGNSNYIKNSDNELILKYFKNCQIETIPNAGHWVHADEPELFYEKVNDFLGK